MYTGVSLSKVNDVISTFIKEGNVKVSSPVTFAFNNFLNMRHNTSSRLWKGNRQIYTLMTYVRTTNSKLGSPDQFQQFEESFNEKGIQWKKCVTICCDARRSLNHISSSHVLPWNGMLGLLPSFVLALVAIDPINSYRVDESAHDRRITYRGDAWCLKGHRATRKAFSFHGHSR